LTSLLDGIVERIAPPFTVSKIEGDAVFAFADEPDLPLRGASVMALLTVCYQAYRARLDQARDLMPCTCWACSMIGDLELAFVLAGRGEAGTGPTPRVRRDALERHVQRHRSRDAADRQVALHMKGVLARLLDLGGSIGDLRIVLHIEEIRRPQVVVPVRDP